MRVLLYVAMLCLLFSIGSVQAKRGSDKHNPADPPGNGSGKGPKRDFSDCGGAKSCLGEERLGKLLKKTGLDKHKTVDDIAKQLDEDDDLGLDMVNEMLVYTCSNTPDATDPVPDAAPQDAAAAAGDRKLLHSHHHSHHHHHRHHRRSLKQSTAPEVASADPAGWMPSLTDVQLTETQTFTLHSRPASTRKILLDFTGHTVTNSAYNANLNISTITVPAFDKDGNPAAWSAGELSDILAIWRAVSEDFAPFDVDVTTEDLGDAVLATNGMRVVIGGDSSWLNQRMGGVAYIPSFGMGLYYQPAFVFAVELRNNPSHIWNTVSHEAAHTLGLSHDGQGAESLYQGHGNWGPIMGAPWNKNVTQFSRGEYAGATNTEDDFAVMSSYLPLISQEQGSTISTATALSFTSAKAGKTTTFTARASGVIRQPEEFDVFRFKVSTTITATFTLQPLAPWGTATAPVPRSNLNATLTVSSAPSATATASLVFTQWGIGLGSVQRKLAAGTHYVSIAPVGAGDPVSTGYSSYGCRGQYQLTVSYV